MPRVSIFILLPCKRKTRVQIFPSILYCKLSNYYKKKRKKKHIIYKLYLEIRNENVWGNFDTWHIFDTKILITSNNIVLDILNTKSVQQLDQLSIEHKIHTNTLFFLFIIYLSYIYTHHTKTCSRSIQYTIIVKK